jgi:hypothetical protein
VAVFRLGDGAPALPSRRLAPADDEASFVAAAP